MPEDRVKEPPGRRLTESGVKLIAGVAASACVAVVVALPKPVPPREPPSIELDRGRADAIVHADRELAARAPKDELAERVTTLYRQQGRGEASGGEEAGAATRRLARLRRALDELEAEHGERARQGLRARALERAMDVLDGDAEEPERQAWLGTFPAMLRKYGLVRSGERVAPELVVRTLYKARWNAIADAPLTDELEPMERRAYWGWLALHASGADMSMRWRALEQYEKAGGDRIAEAKGALAWRAGRYTRAGQWLREAHERNATFRLRNHRLAAVTGQ